MLFPPACRFRHFNLPAPPQMVSYLWKFWILIALSMVENTEEKKYRDIRELSRASKNMIVRFTKVCTRSIKRPL